MANDRLVRREGKRGRKNIDGKDLDVRKDHWILTGLGAGDLDLFHRSFSLCHGGVSKLSSANERGFYFRFSCFLLSRGKFLEILVLFH